MVQDAQKGAVGRSAQDMERVLGGTHPGRRHRDGRREGNRGRERGRGHRLKPTEGQGGGGRTHQDQRGVLQTKLSHRDLGVRAD